MEVKKRQHRMSGKAVRLSKFKNSKLEHCVRIAHSLHFISLLISPPFSSFYPCNILLQMASSSPPASSIQQQCVDLNRNILNVLNKTVPVNQLYEYIPRLMELIFAEYVHIAFICCHVILHSFCYSLLYD